MTIFLIALVLLFFLELLYFKIADRYNIIDKPNQRSSHTQITLRGGGIIFPLATIAGIIIYQPDYIYLALAIFLIALVSFLDDIITLNNKLRIIIHFVSVTLVLFQLHNNGTTIDFANGVLIWLLAVALFIIIIGVINAYNFMDGINGITVLYSLTAILSLFYIQEYNYINLLHPHIFYVVIASLLVFGFFNLRKKAKAFSGDVGSISIALLICYLILQLIFITGEGKWLLLLGVYGLDAVATICCRIVRRENIFEAHRSHLYQYLANEKKYSHLQVSVFYALVQILFNLAIIYMESSLQIVFLFLAVVIVYALYRLKNEGYIRLFVKY